MKYYNTLSKSIFTTILYMDVYGCIWIFLDKFDIEN